MQLAELQILACLLISYPIIYIKKISWIDLHEVVDNLNLKKWLIGPTCVETMKPWCGTVKPPLRIQSVLCAI